MKKKLPNFKMVFSNLKKSTILLTLLFMFSAFAQGQVSVTASAGTLSGSYLTVKEAFDAVNLGAHQGVVSLLITVDIVDNTTAVLNASGSGTAVYTSLSIQPSGIRNLSGSLSGAPLFDLNGADNITINGLNNGTDSLTLNNSSISALSNTATIRFKADASNNTITNCTVLGANGFLQGATTVLPTVLGGTIFFDTGTVTGNDNNTISNCDIGPSLATTLPARAIASLGSSLTIVNDNNTVTGCLIHDFFKANDSSHGIAILSFNSDWSITNNKFYQSAARNQTTSVHHNIILLNNAGNNHKVTGNILGYATSTGTGTYTITTAGTTPASALFRAVRITQVGALTASNISNNTISNISFSGFTSGNAGSGSSFVGIITHSGVTINNGNTLTNLSLSSTATTTSIASMLGIYNFGNMPISMNNNVLNGITVSNTSSGGADFQGIYLNTGAGAASALNNQVGSATSPISVSTATGTSGLNIGMRLIGAGVFNCKNNIISNLNSNTPNIGTNTSSSVMGIFINAGDATSIISQNSISNLSNTNTTASVSVLGILNNGISCLFERNTIFDLLSNSASATAEVSGIKISGGSATYRNNMINLGSSVSKSVQLNGISEFLGTNTIYHNSIYISGFPTTGTANSFAFNGQQTTNTRSFRNNIFFNARSNSGATGKNYAVRFSGTGINPTGLTVNNNIYFANGTGGFIGLYGGADLLDLVALQAAVGQDAASIVANPLFVSATDLNLQTGSPAIDAAFNLLVPNDFAGDSRPGLNALFDIGADEKDGIVQPLNDIAAISFVNPSNGGSRLPNIAFAPQISFTNFGISNQTNFTVRYRIVDSASTEVYNQTVVIPSLASLASVTATFPNVTLSSTGVYTTFAKAELIGDTVATNDQISGTLNISSPLSGTYTVGTAGNYPSLTNPAGIFDSLNNLGASGNIIINIISDLNGETGAVPLNEVTAGFTTLIKPTGSARTITGSSTTALLKINAADGVTIDGTLGSGTSRDLTIENTSTGAVIWIASTATNGALNNIVRNTNVLGNSLLSAQGIIVGGSVFGSAAEVSNSNLTITNNTFKKVQNGIFAVGNATTPDQNWIITNNIFGSTVTSEKLSFRGLAVQNAQTFTISGNQILGVNTASSSTVAGVFIGANSSNGNVFNNKILDIRNTNTGGFGSLGIYLNSSNITANINTYNNFVSDVASYGFATGSTVADNGYGIFVGQGAGYNIYHNTVNMNTSQTVAGLPAALNVGVGVTLAGAVNLRNNILINSQTQAGEKYTILSAAPNTVFGTIDNNDYFSSGTNLGFLTSARATLADIQTGFGQNLASVNIAPNFVSTTDFHLNTNTNATLDNLGAPIATVTTDFDGNTRSTIKPDLGADEFCNIPLAPTGSASQSFCNGATVSNLTATALTGHTIKWYNALNGGSELLTTEVLVNGNHYFASQTITIGGCESTLRLDVTATITTINATLNQTDVLCNGSATGSATVVVSGGTSPYTYLWSNGQTAATASGLITGTYTCVVTDTNGCTNSTISAIITQPTTITASSTSVNVLCNGNATGSATAVVSGGTSPYTYLWSNGQTAATASGLVAGTYTCVVTDANACTNSTISEVIAQPAAITASSTSVNVLCNGNATGSATAVVSGGTSPYTYLWSNGQTAATASSLLAGTYTCVVTDANGCTNSTISEVIAQPAAINNSVTLLPGALSATQTGATYQWFTCPNSSISGAINQTFSPTVNGDYKVVITVAGCSVTSNCVTVSSLANSNFDITSFKYFPNPVNNILNISYSKELTTIKIVNLIGQEVMKNSINANDAKIDMSNLPSGAYLVEIRSLDDFKTIKVIKN